METFDYFDLFNRKKIISERRYDLKQLIYKHRVCCKLRNLLVRFLSNFEVVSV